MPTPITITGRTTSDPELRFTPSGKAVANLSVAVNHRKRNPNGEWEDDGADFYRVDVWDKQAENVAETITKGTEVVVTGTLRSREWDDKDGNKRTSWEIRADVIAPSLRWATAVVTRNERDGGNSQPRARQDNPRPATSNRSEPRGNQPKQSDPWGGRSLESFEQPPF